MQIRAAVTRLTQLVSLMGDQEDKIAMGEIVLWIEDAHKLIEIDKIELQEKENNNNG
jgi:hypothetical protein